MYNIYNVKIEKNDIVKITDSEMFSEDKTYRVETINEKYDFYVDYMNRPEVVIYCFNKQGEKMFRYFTPRELKLIRKANDIKEGDIVLLRDDVHCENSNICYGELYRVVKLNNDKTIIVKDENGYCEKCNKDCFLIVSEADIELIGGTIIEEDDIVKIKEGTPFYNDGIYKDKTYRVHSIKETISYDEHYKPYHVTTLYSLYTKEEGKFITVEENDLELVRKHNDIRKGDIVMLKEDVESDFKYNVYANELYEVCSFFNLTHNYECEQMVLTSREGECVQFYRVFFVIASDIDIDRITPKEEPKDNIERHDIVKIKNSPFGDKTHRIILVDQPRFTKEDYMYSAILQHHITKNDIEPTYQVETEDSNVYMVITKEETELVRKHNDFRVGDMVLLKHEAPCNLELSIYHGQLYPISKVFDNNIVVANEKGELIESSKYDFYIASDIDINKIKGDK